MPKVRISGNRLSLGSWSIPLKVSTNRVDNKRQSQRLSSMAAPSAKDSGIETASEENVPNTNGLSLKVSTMNEISKPEAKKPSMKSMVELAAIITKETGKLEKYLKESGGAIPGFDIESPANFPKLPDDMKNAREEIVKAAKELGDLVTGPTESVRWMAWDVSSSITELAID